MRFILAKIEESTTASDVVKSLTVLHAIRWIAQAWSQVSSHTIQKCFKKAGILNQSLQVVTREVPTEDPFRDLDDDQLVSDDEMQGMIDQLQVATPCTANELASIEEDLAVCADLTDEHWEETFLAELGPSSSKSVHTEDTAGERSDMESESEEECSALPPPRFRNLPEVIACLEDVRYFLECKGHTPQSTEAMSLISSLTMLHSQNLSKCSRQSSLLDFFPL